MPETAQDNLTAKDILAAAPGDRLRLLRENMETLSGDDLNEIIRSVTTSVTSKLAIGMPDLVAEALNSMSDRESGEAEAEDEDEALPEVDEAEPEVVPAADPTPEVVEPDEPVELPLVLTERVSVVPDTSPIEASETAEADEIHEMDEPEEAVADPEADDGEGYETVAIELPDEAPEDHAPRRAEPPLRMPAPAPSSRQELALPRQDDFDPTDFDEPDEPEAAEVIEDIAPSELRRRAAAIALSKRLAARPFQPLLAAEGEGAGEDDAPKSLRERIYGLLPIPTAIVAAFFGTAPISAAIAAPPNFSLVVAIVILLMVSWLVCEATRIDARRNTALTVRLAAALSCYYPIESLGKWMAGGTLGASDLIYLIVPVTLGISVLWSAVKDRRDR